MKFIFTLLLAIAVTALPDPPTTSSIIKAQSNALRTIERRALDDLKASSSIDTIFQEAVTAWNALTEDEEEEASPGASFSLYGFFQQAINGDNNTQKPPLWMPQERAKWEFW
jgi:acyl-CoA-binding protein